MAVFEDGDNTVSARGDSTTFSNADSRLNMAGDTTYVIEDELTLLLWTYPLNNTGNECLFEKSLNDNSVVFSLRASSTNFTF